MHLERFHLSRPICSETSVRNSSVSVLGFRKCSFVVPGVGIRVFLFMEISSLLQMYLGRLMFLS